MSIQKYLDKIKDAVFGKDIREAIYNSIKQCYDDAAINNDNANMEVKFARGSHPTLNDRLTENEKNQKEIYEQLESIVPQSQFIIGNIVFTYGAVGDGKSHKAREKFNSLDSAKVYYPTIQSLDDEIDLLAIEKALLVEKNIRLWKGVFTLNRPLILIGLERLSGYNRKETTLLMIENDKAIIQVNGDMIKISDIGLKYEVYQELFTNSHAIHKTRNACNFIELDGLLIENCYSGIRGTNAFFNWSFNNIRINGYSKSSLWLDGNGSTGCVFNNIYITNWKNFNTREKYSVSTACHIQGFSESVINQLNIEHVVCGYALLINDCDNIIINSFHIEGYEQKLGKGGSVIRLLSNSTLLVNSFTMSFSGFRVDDDNRQDFALLKMGKNCRVTFNDIKFHRMNEIETYDSSTQRVIVKALSFNNLKNAGAIRLAIKENINESCRISFNNFRDDKSFWNEKAHAVNMTVYPFDIINFNDNYYFRETNGKKEVYMNSRINQGKWDIGDKNIFSDIINDFNYIGEICVGKGDFSNPTTGLTCSTLAWQSSITIDNPNGYKLNKGDRIELVGVKNSNGGNYVTISSDLYNGNKYNIEEVIGDYTLSDIQVKIAPPLFKGFGAIEN